jgi:hypothetical protein
MRNLFSFVIQKARFRLSGRATVLRIQSVNVLRAVRGKSLTDRSTFDLVT